MDVQSEAGEAGEVRTASTAETAPRVHSAARLTDHPAYRPALVAILLLCAAAYGYLGVYVPLRAGGYDFTGPYEAAYALAHHAPLPVYDVAAQRIYNAAVLHLPQGPSDFRWTPQTAAVLIPLGFLPYGAAHLIWLLIAEAATLGSLLLVARCIAVAARRRDKSEGTGLLPLTSTWGAFAVLLCFAVVCQPLTDSLRLGQSTPLLLLGFALLLYGVVFDRPTLAGCGLALAILMKLFPAALIPYYLWRGRYRLCAVAVGAIAALTLLTLPLTGTGMYTAFARAINTYGDQPNAGKVNLSLYHALIVGPNALLRPGQMEPVGGVAAALALLVCVLLYVAFLLLHGRPDFLSRLRRGGDIASGEGERDKDEASRARRELLSFGWAMCMLLLLEPVDWIFYYLALLIPLGYLLIRLDAWWAETGTRRRDASGTTMRAGAAGSGGRTQCAPRDGQAVASDQKSPSGWLLLAGMLAYLVATFPLPLDSRVAPYTSLAYVVGICVRPAAALALWLMLARLARLARREWTARIGPSHETRTEAVPTLDAQ